MGENGGAVGGPSHAMQHRRRKRRWPVTAAGLAAVTVAVAIAVPALRQPPGITPANTPTSIQHITVDPIRIPLSAAELLGLRDRAPDFGPLADDRRRSACLAALGYPGGSPIRGAAPITVAGHPAVLLLLDGEQPGSYVGIAVRPTCNAADSAALTETVVPGP